MAEPIVDQVLKEMTEHYAEQFIRLIFPKEKFSIIFSKLDKEPTVKTRLTDRVIMLNTAGGKRLLHLEFQLRYKRKIPERLFVYSGALTAKYQMKVASILFLNLETNAQRRAEYFGFAIPIARRHFGLGMIQSIFKEADMVNIEWENIPHFGDALKAKKQEALQKGGAIGMQEMLIDLLNAQFGKLPDKTIRAIQTLQEPRKLKTIARKSLKAESLAEVQKLLVASKTKTNGRNGSASQRKK